MKKTVIKFYADWCGPCKVYSKTFNKVKQNFKNQVNFEEINIEEPDRGLLKKYNVKAVPTTVIIHSEQEVEVTPGIIPTEELINKINK